MTYHDRDHNDSKFMAPAPLTGTRLNPFKRLAAVIALTLMLGTMLLSVTASPASARPYVGANGAVTSCFDTGGDANVYYLYGTYYTICTYDDGSYWWTVD